MSKNKQRVPVLPVRTWAADSHGHWFVEDADHFLFVLLEFEEELEHEEQRRRAHDMIVQRVNLHDELVTFVRDIQDDCLMAETGETENMTKEFASRTWDVCQELLAKTKESE